MFIFKGGRESPASHTSLTPRDVNKDQINMKPECFYNSKHELVCLTHTDIQAGSVQPSLYLTYSVFFFFTFATCSLLRPIVQLVSSLPAVDGSLQVIEITACVKDHTYSARTEKLLSPRAGRKVSFSPFSPGLRVLAVCSRHINWTEVFSCVGSESCCVIRQKFEGGGVNGNWPIS